ncbi:DUF6093 family protein [Streptomyces anulatus]|uniref:DUF6093 family protein n=1 Tax=Streptomyces TaxID=1883 RepID=UPI00093CC5BF|nr:DUF6093 family protein [Streptomyces sp. TSRI0395]OKI83770.1 hypothetical protein AMK12_11630 [Streptomyces sp. TSRI0395]
MSIRDVLARGRWAAEARMLDTVRVFTQGEDVFDRDTGVTVPGPVTILYEGHGRVKPVSQSTGEETQAGEREVVLREVEVALPWATVLPAGTRVLPGTRVKVLASEDPRMAGLVLWVTSSQFSAQVTAWRISTEDRS